MQTLSDELRCQGFDAPDAYLRAASALLPYWSGYRARDALIAEGQCARRHALSRRLWLGVLVTCIALVATSARLPALASQLATGLGGMAWVFSIVIGLLFASGGPLAHRMWVAWGDPGSLGLALRLLTAGGALVALGAVLD